MRDLLFFQTLVLSLAAFFWAPRLTAAVTLSPVSRFAGLPDSSEILAFDPFARQIYSTYGTLGNGGVELVHLADPAHPTPAGRIDLSRVDGLNVRSVSSVAADPLGRGFGAATFIPERSGSERGRVVLFDPRTQSILRSIEVGFHPDSLRFSNDGSKLFVVNEGEPISEGSTHFDAPGSMSMIDLSSVRSTADLAGISPAATYDFSPGNLGSGVTLSSLRVHPSNATSVAGRQNDAEPEFVTQSGDKLYVTLQENNAIAEFDLSTKQWTAIHSLGVIQQRVDASPGDGVQIDDLVHGLPMPDAIASVASIGRTFLLTANEGDSRPADNVAAGHPGRASDEARFQQLGTGGRPGLDSTTDAALDALYAGDAQADAALGRLRVSLIDGDLDSDGDIDRPTMFGTRSFSIWDATSGALVFDSGSDFEEITSIEVPDLYNSNGTSATVDGRSQNKGPEPEGLTVGEAYGRTYAFIGLERTGGIMVYDVTNPAAPEFADYVNTGERSPEGLKFVSVDDSPIGVPLLLVGYEVESSIGVFALHRSEATGVPDAGVPVWVGLAAWLALLARARSGLDPSAGNRTERLSRLSICGMKRWAGARELSQSRPRLGMGAVCVNSED